jgi:RNA polymerase sigma factor (sigma-70 family)
MSVRDEQIVEGLSMVRRMAARYRGTPLGADDAYGVGSLALVEAAQRFDPENGAPFLGYAFLRVRGAMADACRAGHRGARQDREIVCDPAEFCEIGDLRALRIEGHIDLMEAVGRLRSRLRLVLLRHACGEPHTQIAADMGVTESRVSQLLGMARRRVLSEAGVRLD